MWDSRPTTIGSDVNLAPDPPGKGPDTDEEQSDSNHPANRARSRKPHDPEPNDDRDTTRNDEPDEPFDGRR